MDAATYDAWYDSPLGRACLVAEVALLRQGVRDWAGKTVLEVGCGSGRFLGALSQDATRAVGIDRDLAMLNFANHHTPSALESRSTWIAGDASALPFAEGSFDVVFESTLLCFCGDPLPMIREMVRVCQSGGVILLGELNPWAPWQWWRRVKARFGRGSFRGVSWHRPRDLLAALKASGCRPHWIGRAIFSPPLNIRDWLHWRSAAEWIGARLWPWAGAYHVVGGMKR